MPIGTASATAELILLRCVKQKDEAPQCVAPRLFIALNAYYLLARAFFNSFAIALSAAAFAASSFF